MRRASTFIAVTLMFASLSTACRHESSVTGPSTGTGMLTGQIIPVGDLAGASAAGINVTSSGNVAVTDANGRFVFTGLDASNVSFARVTTSSNRQLTFSRGDGINASGSVSVAASEVVVQLQKTQATIVVTGRAKREIEGLITKISSTSITVDDASTHGPVTATITLSTVIRKGNQTLTTDGLNVGDRVHVKASVNDDASLTAFEIMLQESGTGNGGQTRELEGPITEVSEKSITVTNASTGGPVTAAITGNTVIRKGNTTLTTKDLNVGDRVHVKTTVNQDGSLTATEIMLQNPAT